MRHIWLVCALTTITTVKVESNVRVKRMSGGKDVDIKDYPHAVSLERDGRHYCGGNIISSYHLVTACHCMDNENIYYIKARAGTSYREKNGSLHTIESWQCHPDYDADALSNDVAVMRVKEEFKLDASRRIIKLSNDTEWISPNDNGTVAGWGYISYGFFQAELADQLQAMDMTIVNGSMCSETYEPYLSLSPGQICAEKDYTSGTCRGDSGGGLIIDDTLVGLLSFSANDCDYHFLPAVFTDVAYFREWIEKKIKTMEHGADRGIMGWVCGYIWCPSFLLYVR